MTNIELQALLAELPPDLEIMIREFNKSKFVLKEIDYCDVSETQRCDREMGYETGIKFIQLY